MRYYQAYSIMRSPVFIKIHDKEDEKKRKKKKEIKIKKNIYFDF